MRNNSDEQTSAVAPRQNKGGGERTCMCGAAIMDDTANADVHCEFMAVISCETVFKVG